MSVQTVYLRWHWLPIGTRKLLTMSTALRLTFPEWLVDLAPQAVLEAYDDPERRTGHGPILSMPVELAACWTSLPDRHSLAAAIGDNLALVLTWPTASNGFGNAEARKSPTRCPRFSLCAPGAD
jgi:hypothetical protein